MKAFLLALVCLEGAALVAGAGAVLLVPERFERRAPPAPEFVPAVYDAEGGEEARYRLEEISTGKPLGYLYYRVLRVEDLGVQKLGRVIHLRITETTPSGATTSDLVRLVKPEIHGFLPPTSRDDDLPPGDLPVVARIESAEVPMRRGTRPGFLVEAVRPRWAARGEGVYDRLWLVATAPVFGLVRRERGGVAWVLE
jgi:hypothetical protein